MIGLPVENGCGSSLVVANVPQCQEQKKADAAEHPEMFGRIGLLVNEPPGTAGLPFI
jgi:hypothetical protein